jgi:hypothetical protein
MKIIKGDRTLSLEEFEKETGALFLPKLEFGEGLLEKLKRKGEKLHKKGELTLEQSWLGSYFKKEILGCILSDVSIRWIDPTLGWGVFSERPIRKMEFIAEYTGKVRKRRPEDSKNAYCFEYLITQGYETPYIIDAQEQGGLSRYINHSFQPNLSTALATIDGISHVVIYAKEALPAGVELRYDYGLDYWAHRSKPL